MHFLHEADTGGESHVVVLEMVRPLASVLVDFFRVDLHFLWAKERYQHGWLFGMGILGNIDSNYDSMDDVVFALYWGEDDVRSRRGPVSDFLEKHIYIIWYLIYPFLRTKHHGHLPSTIYHLPSNI